MTSETWEPYQRPMLYCTYLSYLSFQSRESIISVKAFFLCPQIKVWYKCFPIQRNENNFLNNFMSICYVLFVQISAITYKIICRLDITRSSSNQHSPVSFSYLPTVLFYPFHFLTWLLITLRAITAPQFQATTAPRFHLLCQSPSIIF